jgi:hypothetical protein
MTIEPIAKLAGTSQLNKLNKSESKGKGVSPKDGFKISDAAKKAQRTSAEIKLAKQVLGNVPEIRRAMLEEIREKLANGFYLQHDVTEAVAERLLGRIY